MLKRETNFAANCDGLSKEMEVHLKHVDSWLEVLRSQKVVVAKICGIDVEVGLD